MTKKGKKILTLTIVFIFIVSIFFLVNWELLLENIMVIIWGESTVYSKNYNESAFWSIKKGMKMSEVKSLLGPPLWKSGKNDEYWNYSNQKKSNYRMRVIGFDNNGKVFTKTIGLYVD